MFRFKQFNLIQENCPIKFGTDSMTLAGFVPILCNLETILDIGSGSGIISLIMAQRTSALIDGIEIDQGGYSDMKKNFEYSKWPTRLYPHNISLQSFEPKKKYDLIISNPPFFNNSLKSNNQKKMNARHTSELSFEEISAFSKRHLSDKGYLAVILPNIESNTFIDCCTLHGISLIQKISIKSFPETEVIRNILIFSTKLKKYSDDIVVIYKDEKIYTDQYEKMLSDYFITL